MLFIYCVFICPPQWTENVNDDGSLPARLSIICLSTMQILEDADWITVKCFSTEIRVLNQVERDAL